MIEWTYNHQIADRIRDSLDQLGITYFFDEKIGAFISGVSMEDDCPFHELEFLIDVRDDAFVVRGISPLFADSSDSEMIRRMAEFIARANYSLPDGCFEMSFNTGRIFYRTFVNCDDGLPSTKVTVNALYVCMTMFERYGSGIADMIYTDKSPADAIDECENKE